jgi:hypothetical protein
MTRCTTWRGVKSQTVRSAFSSRPLLHISPAAFSQSVIPSVYATNKSSGLGNLDEAISYYKQAIALDHCGPTFISVWDIYSMWMAGTPKLGPSCRTRWR